MMERNVLGKGLSALIPEGAQQRERIQTIALDRIRPSSLQPRTRFTDTRLNELAESIKEKGVIQPILVRQKGDEFEIIAGERRYRAVKKLGHTEISAIVKNVEDEDLLEISIIENIQREELNKVEEAKAFQRLATQFGMTHEAIAKKVSKDRATITNSLRLLELSGAIHQYIEDGRISAGHAKALLPIVNEKRQIRICERIVKKNLSVRQAENLVRDEVTSKIHRKSHSRKDIHVLSVEERLQHRFGTRVQIIQGKKRGKIVMDYYSADDLNRLITALTSNG
jgi:ParB family transcriptional regulator, chromosome partitioning protein